MRLERQVEPRAGRRRHLAAVIGLLLLTVFSALMLAHTSSVGKEERARVGAAHADINEYFLAYRQWLERAVDPSSWCPTRLWQLDDVMGRPGRPDPWGWPYVMDCVAGGGAFGVASAGPDHRFGTKDDVWSYLRMGPLAMVSDHCMWPLTSEGFAHAMGCVRRVRAGDSPWVVPRGMADERNPWR